MPKTKQQKQDNVALLTEQLAKAKTIVFANYSGLTMNQLSSVRTNLRKMDATFNITKNNLLKLALNNNKLDLPNDDVLVGPVATLMAFEDEISPIKTLTKAIKDFGIGEVKAGFLNGEFLDSSKVTQLSTLPTKDELRAKIVGALGGPLYGIVGVLQANLRNLVYVLDQIKIAKGGLN